MQCIRRKSLPNPAAFWPPEPIMKPAWGNLILMPNSRLCDFLLKWLDFASENSLNNIKCHRIFEKKWFFKELFLERFFWEPTMILSLFQRLFLRVLAIVCHNEMENEIWESVRRTNKRHYIVCKLYGLFLQCFFEHDHIEQLKKELLDVKYMT